MFRTLVSGAAAAVLLALVSASSPAFAQNSFAPCSASDYPGLTFGPNVPSYSVGFTQGQCYCGAWSNISPQQAQQQGWYASCNNGQGICNYAPGTIASNAVCGPFKK
jgi:hypothetical protein